MTRSEENFNEDAPESPEEESEEWQDPGASYARMHEEEQGDREEADAEPPEEVPVLFRIFQAFLIPTIIIGLIILMFIGVRWFFSGSQTADQLLKDLKTERGRERDFVARQLAQTLVRDKQSLQAHRRNPEFKSDCLDLFKNARTESLQAYMAMVLGILQHDDPQALRELEKQLASTTSERVKMAILRALGDIGDPGSSDVVIPYMKRDGKGQDPGVRQAAVYAAGQLRTESCLAPLTNALNDPIPHVRLNAAIGLAHYGDRRLIPVKEVEKVLGKMLDRKKLQKMKQPDENNKLQPLKREDINRMMFGAVRSVRVLKSKKFLGKIRSISKSTRSSRALRKEARKTISVLTSSQDE